MTCLRWSTALLALCLLAPEAAAQKYLVPSPYGRAVAGGSLTYSRGRPGKGLSLSLGAFTTRGFYADPFAPFGPFPFAPPARVTVLYSVAPPPPPPVVVVLPTPFFLEGLPLDLLPRNRLEAPPEPGEPPPVPEEAPRRPVPPVEPDPPPPKPPEPPKKEEPPPPPKPPEKKKPPTLPRRPAPEANPAAESDRLVALGRQEFAAGAYGRAALRFGRAAEVDPQRPMTHFLLAQALVALGKYHDAVDAVHAGLALDPTWPASAFRPLGLYADNVAEYSDHLAALEEALERHPGDPVLLFLTAYQLWFDGRKEEARPLFRAARPGAADREAVDAFLRAAPSPVL